MQRVFFATSLLYILTARFISKRCDSNAVSGDLLFRQSRIYFYLPHWLLRSKKALSSLTTGGKFRLTGGGTRMQLDCNNCISAFQRMVNKILKLLTKNVFFTI